MKTATALVAVLLLAVVGVGAWYYNAQQTENEPQLDSLHLTMPQSDRANTNNKRAVVENTEVETLLDNWQNVAFKAGDGGSSGGRGTGRRR